MGEKVSHHRLIAVLVHGRSCVFIGLIVLRTVLAKLAQYLSQLISDPREPSPTLAARLAALVGDVLDLLLLLQPLIKLGDVIEHLLVVLHLLLGAFALAAPFQELQLVVLLVDERVDLLLLLLQVGRALVVLQHGVQEGEGGKHALFVFGFC